MNPSAVLRVTEKGAEEIARHTVGLGLRQRGIMLLLSKPRTLQDLLHKSVLPTEESYTILHELMRDGFITQDDGTAPAPSATPPAVPPGAYGEWRCPRHAGSRSENRARPR